jgi:hypothetical protein
MAIGIGTDFKIYQDQINGAVVETVMQFLDAFNAPSNNTIVLQTEAERGDFRYESFFTEGGDVTYRNPNDATTDLTDNPLLQDEDISVKLHRTFVKAVTRNQWLRVGADPAMFSRLLGIMFAKKMLKDMLNTGIAACAAALAGVAGDVLKYDGSGAGLTHLDLNSGLSKFGDQAGSILCWVMHSVPWHALVGSAIGTERLEVSAFAVQQGVTGTLGRPVVVTDSPALVLAGSPHKYITLGLTENAIRLQDSESPYTASQEVTGKANLFQRLQTEYAYNLGLRGFKYRVGAGANPDAPTVASSANWTQNATDIKNTAGIYVVTL